MKKASILLFLIMVPFLLSSQNLHNITVNVKDIKTSKGKVYYALFNNEADFLEKRYKDAIEMIEINKSTTTFKNIPSGVYAVSIFHDKNNNAKLDTNFMGIPKEAYGCSNNAKGFMGPPKWSDAKFNLKEDILITINL